jgi:hypothetical protein
MRSKGINLKLPLSQFPASLAVLSAKTPQTAQKYREQAAYDAFAMADLSRSPLLDVFDGLK